MSSSPNGRISWRSPCRSSSRSSLLKTYRNGGHFTVPNNHERYFSLILCATQNGGCACFHAGFHRPAIQGKLTLIKGYNICCSIGRRKDHCSPRISCCRIHGHYLRNFCTLIDRNIFWPISRKIYFCSYIHGPLLCFHMH